MGFPEGDYDPTHYIRVYRERMARGVGVFSNAYMITASHGDIRKKLITKEEYIFQRTIGYLHRDREVIEKTLSSDKLCVAHEKIAGYTGWGSFLAGQVIADLKYTRYLDGAVDWWTWAASGPGSKRGLNRILGRPLHAVWKEYEWLENVQRLQTLMPEIGGQRLHAQDVQSCLCEYDKYMRIALGEGRMKMKYRRPE